MVACVSVALLQSSALVLGAGLAWPEEAAGTCSSVRIRGDGHGPLARGEHIMIDLLPRSLSEPLGSLACRFFALHSVADPASW